ncbi:MAG: xanthine dehydrogenase family protein subunit M [Thermodesulfobacteriota bacterium]|nr:xanthine dehydrogenase family protein subunit M [Thermodesulfobacteriota bacterium]
MLLPKFKYHDPSTLEEACQVIGELKQETRLLAGGTDLLVNMKKGIIATENLISLGRIEELKEKKFFNGQLRLGACMTVAELAQSDEMKDMFNALHMGANSLGSPLIRNLATIGGNIVSARPSADLPPSLMAYDAHVVLRKSSRERTVPLSDFFLGPGQTIMEPVEILTEILLDKCPPRSGAAFIKLGVRKALEISLVNVAAFLCLDGQKDFITSSRVVLGAVAPIPMRAPSAEKILLGEKPDEDLFSRAGKAAARDCLPIDDFRGSAGYRRAMVEVLTKRTLKTAYDKIFL